MSEDLAKYLTQMRPGAKQARIVVDNQVNRNVLHVTFEAAFVFKATTETGGGKEIEEARHDPARNIDPAKGAEIQGQVAAETPHNDAEQRQSTTAVNTAVGQCAFGHIFRLQIFRQTSV